MAFQAVPPASEVVSTAGRADPVSRSGFRRFGDGALLLGLLRLLRRDSVDPCGCGGSILCSGGFRGVADFAFVAGGEVVEAARGVSALPMGKGVSWNDQIEENGTNKMLPIPGLSLLHGLARRLGRDVNSQVTPCTASAEGKVMELAVGTEPVSKQILSHQSHVHPKP